eukprot:Nitzschia sp. Nitz4//scaffold131_size63436//41371//42354//NITZ4_006280-RA/size63436-processed-gene-0.70-mRNA-1//-1//CDS//3329535283//8271//frame0
MATLDNDAISIDLSIARSSFVQDVASKPLRITCYGSSSAYTPEIYLKEARSLGYILARRGHTCVNGAGSYGCMAAMNDGAVAGNGHLVGVIHEMFLVDNGYGGHKTLERDGGYHSAFSSSGVLPFDEQTGPTRELLIAGGNDLQERKRLLVEKTQGLIVLPGGPGTWDELWEMACIRHIGVSKLPIVCVNVQNYYQPFREMLERAYHDKLIKLPPEEIVYFADTAEDAVRWMESAAGKETAVDPSTYSKRRFDNRMSFFSPSGVDRRLSSLDKAVEGSAESGTPSAKIQSVLSWVVSSAKDVDPSMLATFSFGVVAGLTLSLATNRR